MMAMTAPATYFQPDKTRPCQIANVNDLQFTTSGDILEEYPTGYKGGTHDNYGRATDRRGGGTETENASRHRCPPVANWQDPRLQNRGILAREAKRVGAMDRGTKAHHEGLISVSSVASMCDLSIGTRSVTHG